MDLIKVLTELNGKKERLEQEANLILVGYFGSLKKLADIVANAEPRQATTEEIADYNRYITLVSDIIDVKRKMIATKMIVQGKTWKEIIAYTGYREEYSLNRLLGETA